MTEEIDPKITTEATERYQPKEDDVTVFAETNFRNRKVKFGIKRRDRRQHMYVIGKSGVGKSTMLENMIVSDIMRGEGVAVVDPHGDLAEKIMQYIPSWRINDVAYFNPADLSFPVAFNPLESVDEAQKHLVASGVVGVFKKIFAESWGPRLEYLLRNAILALLDYPGSTLLGIMRILVDKGYRAKVLEKVKDPVVKSFWVDEYAKYPDRFQVEAVAPIQNKVGQFLSNFLIRNIVGQVKSTIDMRDIMDNRKILVINLAKGRIGEDTTAMLGAMLVTKIQIAAMERIQIPEKERKDFYLYVDEFQNFATDSFATILSEARKYRLNLIIAHQYIEQLKEEVYSAVFGNVGTLVCFRVGPADAEKLITEFSPIFIEEDLVNLTKYDIYLRLLIDGVASDPFSATTLPPLSDDLKAGNLDKIIKISRERYAVPREVIEEKISRWTSIKDETSVSRPANASYSKESNFNQKAKAAVAGVGSDSEIKTAFKTVCSLCGKETEVYFAPDGVRPVYCKDCLKKTREEKIAKAKLPTASDRPRVGPASPKAISLNEAVQKPPVNFAPSQPEPAVKAQPLTAPEIIKEQSVDDNFTAKAKKIVSGQTVKF
ncbi:MAG: CxxC-x17-CxxC domain-containing protein [Candidatus Buchananbacteria bacterium]